MILEVKDLCFHYPRKDTMIFNNVSFGIDKGEILSIIGTNGAGKSTLLNCVANLLNPTSGEIFIDGKAMCQMNGVEIAKYIGYVPQVHNPSYAYTVLEFVVMGRTPYISILSKPSEEDYTIAIDALKQIGIYHLADKDYTELSGGERQQVTIARVIAQQPKVILLDEPTAHLDFGNQLRTIEMVKQLSQHGYAIIMTTHVPDHVVILNGKTGILDTQGQFTFGATKEVISSESLSKLYNINLKLFYIDEVKRETCIAIKS